MINKNIGDLGFEDIEEAFETHKIIDNCQVRVTAGCVDREAPCDESMLEMAIENLKSNYAYVGFQHEFSTLVHSLIVGEKWPSILFVDRHRNQGNTIEPDRELINLAEKYIGMDVRLYKQAMESFAVDQKRSEASLSQYLADSATDNIPDVVFNFLPATLMGLSGGTIPKGEFSKILASLENRGISIQEI